MLEIQKYLKSGKTLENLEKEFGISNVKHPIFPLVLMNYSQIDSPKTHILTLECRSLVLELGTWNVISRSFDRFFNKEEVLEITGLFNWDNFVGWQKVDGSLCSLFWYGDCWHFTTRASWGNGLMQECGFTWEELFRSISPNYDRLNERYSYQFEMCSLHNRVVTIYPKPKLYLLGITEGGNNGLIGGKLETHVMAIINTAREIGVDYPLVTDNWSIVHMEKLDVLDEGFVLLDNNGLRLKIKNSAYLAIHRMKGNNNEFLYKNLYDVIIKGEEDELLVYFPEASIKVNTLKSLIIDTKEILHTLWAKIKGTASQKEFALALTKNMPPLGWVLFECRRHNLSIDEIFASSRYAEKIKKGILELIQ